MRAGAKRTACEQENAAAVAAANAPLALYFTWWLVYGAWLLHVRVRLRVMVRVRFRVRVRVSLTLTLTLT